VSELQDGLQGDCAGWQAALFKRETPEGGIMTGSQTITQAVGDGRVKRTQKTGADTAAAVTLVPFIVNQAIIKAVDYAIYVGDSAGQTMPLGVGEAWALDIIDLNTLYFKNYTAGANGVIQVIGI